MWEWRSALRLARAAFLRAWAVRSLPQKEHWSGSSSVGGRASIRRRMQCGSARLAVLLPSIFQPSLFVKMILTDCCSRCLLCSLDCAEDFAGVWDEGRSLGGPLGDALSLWLGRIQVGPKVMVPMPSLRSFSVTSLRVSSERLLICRVNRPPRMKYVRW